MADCARCSSSPAFVKEPWRATAAIVRRWRSSMCRSCQGRAPKSKSGCFGQRSRVVMDRPGAVAQSGDSRTARRDTVGPTPISVEGAMYDAIVVGARCAGASTAMLLARQGLDVLLVDRATFPSEI